MWRRLLAGLAVMQLALAAVACGEGGGTGPRTLTWFIFNEPSGVLPQIAGECSRLSGGRYQIEFEYLPSDADSQREQLVRRLGAEDATIDIMGMDVIWTGEFTNAGWLAPVPDDLVGDLEDQVFPAVLDTARFEGRLFGVPAWTNTQLLWYRTDRVDSPPETWAEMIEQAEAIGPNGTIQLQANRYEGLVVWTVAMIQSAGGEVLRGPREVALQAEPTKLALGTMGRLANSPAASPDISTSTEDSARLAFESGDSTFMINYPFVVPSARENAPEVFENMAAAKYPRVDPDIESRPPLGGINLGVSAFSANPDLAFEAIECIVQPENQLLLAREGGLPPVLTALYDRPEIEEIYPGFSDVLFASISDAAPRPAETPAYQDVSLAIQREVHPVTAIDPRSPDQTYQDLRQRVRQAVQREGLL
ncbi:MAG: extracellular solute-binding protein [Actinomycetota bacterium]|nr:extracellular solute-binding protein [Actinomycetota bacterium]